MWVRGKRGLDPVRSVVSWAQSMILQELLALRTNLGKSEASQASGFLGPTSLCSPEQQEPRRSRGYLSGGERERW